MGTVNKCFRNPTPAELAAIRTLIRKAQWRPATSPEYKTAPHSYVVKQKNHGITAAQWQQFADVITKCGSWRTWRDGKRYKYVVVDRDCFWISWPCLNRASAATLQS